MSNETKQEQSVKEILEVIKKHPKEINKFDLKLLSLDDWTLIFKNNENVKKYLSDDIIKRKDIQAILISHGHCRKFGEFKADIPTSKNFIRLCMCRSVTFTAKEINEIDKVFPSDSAILESAFKSYNLKGVLRRKLKKSQIIEFAKNAEHPNKIMGDFDLYRLPERFKKDEEFIKEICLLVPTSYSTVLLLKQDYSKEFILYILNHLLTVPYLGWELQQSWNYLKPDKKQDKEIAQMFFHVMYQKEKSGNHLINIENFVKDKQDLLNEMEEFNEYVDSRKMNINKKTN